MPYDWVIKLGEEIEQKQKELRKINSKSPLLKMVDTSDLHGIHGMRYDFTGRFAEKYFTKINTMEELLREYLKDLEKEINENSNH